MGAGSMSTMWSVSKMSGETRCRVCGRLLTAKESVERGIGPVCWRRLKQNHSLEDYEETES